MQLLMSSSLDTALSR